MTLRFWTAVSTFAAVMALIDLAFGHAALWWSLFGVCAAATIVLTVDAFRDKPVARERTPHRRILP